MWATHSPANLSSQKLTTYSCTCWPVICYFFFFRFLHFFLLLKKAHFLSWFFWIFIRLLIASTWKNQFSDFCQPGVRNVDFPSDPPLEIAFCSCTRWPVIKGICHPSLYSLILSGDSFQWIGRYDVFASCNANAEICQDSIPKNEMLQNKNSMAGDLTLILFSVVFFLVISKHPEKTQTKTSQ